MKTRSLLMLTAAVMATAVSCSSPPPGGLEALTAAEDHFKAVSTQPEESEKLWGLKELKIFGRDTRMGVIAGGKPAVAIRGDSPDTYEVTIPYWCAGKTTAGDSVKRKGRLAVIVHGKPGGGWEILKTEFRSQEGLSAWRQLGAWFGWGVVVALILNIAAAILSALFGGEKWPFLLAAIGSAIGSGFIASMVFATSGAVAVAVALSAIGALSRIRQVANG